MMRARSFQILASLALAAPLGGCNPLGYPDCFRVRCPYPPVYSASYAGYIPAVVDGRPAFGEPPFDDPFADYTQRSLTITQTAGNAQAADLALQTDTPWPRYSKNTNIPGNGARMVRAINQFESGKRPNPGSSESGGGTSSGSEGGGGPGGGMGGASGGAPAGGGF
jgi:hypothetical protein